MARGSQDFQTFDMKAAGSGNLPSTPFNDGGDARMAAAVFANLGATLGKIADKAAVRNATAAGQAAGEAGVPLPETYVDKTVQKGTAGQQDQMERRGKAKMAPAGGGGNYYDRLAQIESGGNPNARNKDSGAAGLYQFMPGTARQYNLDNPYDPAQANAAVRRLTADNMAHMRKVLGRNPTDGELYLAHQQGAGGAAKLLRDPNARAVDVVGAKAVQWNGGNANMTAGEFANLWINKFQGGKGGGGSVGSGVPSISPALTPDIVTEQIRTRLPEVKPLALRNDGTLSGDAYDRALTETQSWRMNARVDAAFNEIYAEHKDDPVAFQKAMQDTSDNILKDAEAMGPEVKQAMAQRIVQRSTAYIQDVNAKREQKAEEERKVSALSALDAQDQLLERQAYALGATQDGDAQLADLTGKALNSIDAAVSSGAISLEEGRRKREATLQSMTVSRIKGVFDALPNAEDKQRFADGLMQEWQAKDSPLGAINLATMESLVGGLTSEARRLTKEAQAVSAFDKAKFERLANDDLASMAATGTGLAPGGTALDFAQVEKTLGSDAAYDWLAKREVAKATYEATAGLEKMTGDQIAEQLADTEPKAGEEGFAAKQAAHNAALKKADAILKQRAEDPAAAAEQAFPDIAQEKDPVARSRLRMDAQAALGLAPANRLPLTAREADSLAQRIAMVEDNPELLQTEMEAMMTEVQGSYKTLADDVMGQVLTARGVRKTTATLGSALMMKLNLGQMPEDPMLKAYRAMQSVDYSGDAMDGKAVVPKKPQAMGGGARGGARPVVDNRNPAAARAKAPTTASINMLRKDPTLAPQFDAKFGEGAAEQFLKERNAPVRRKLPDGSVELTYEDGWVEVLRPDGSVSGGPAK